MNKKELRKEILKHRSVLSSTEVKEMSAVICEHTVLENIYEKAQDVCVYMPIRNEVDVSMLIEDARNRDKRIWLPRVNGSDIDFYLYEADTELSAGAYGILEPESDIILMPDENTLVIMPGAVFSRAGDRIGYGGGYYDRYLAKHCNCSTIALCYSLQIVDEIPSDAHDIRPDHIICEMGKIC
ncbi:MAG: 5-formyltetrahydrofolate cyclo-ligase [Bacillota bacterium]|nr:5-formyltetrahydrofolate cyclo-ligase [Bacillota bacterium]